MSTDPRELFTASEIAVAINWDKRRVVNALAATPRTGTKLASGNEAPVWAIAILPESLLGEIERMRVAHYYATPADVLRNPTKAWTPRLPLSQVHEDERRKAERLQSAFAVALALPPGTSLAERARAAAPSFLREFGYPVSERRIQFLLARTLDRDRGARAWQCMELYLPDNPRRKPEAARPLPCSAFDDLGEELDAIKDRANPTPEDRGYCWRKAVEFFHSRTAEGAKATQLKRDLCAFLLNTAPFLADSRQAMKRNLNRKLTTAAEKGVSALADQRTANSGRHRQAPEWDVNIELLVNHTKVRQDIISQAWRELHLGTAPGGLRFTPAFREFYPFDSRLAKSQVPNRVRHEVRRRVTMARPMLQGGRKQYNAQPSYQQDWSTAFSNHIHTADDVTADFYAFEWDEDGAYEFEGRRFNVGQPQMVPMICDRTDLPLGIVTELTRQPNSHHVHRLLSETWLNPDFGLPHVGAKLERGAFAALKVRALFSWPELDERFLKEGISLRLHQARGPKAKSAIERYAGMLHRQLSHVPGFCGNRQRDTMPANLQRFLDSLKRVDQPLKAEVDPREMLMSIQEARVEIRRAMHLLANEPQNGGRLRGLSPAEAWKEFHSGKPNKVLPDSLRYLLATQRFDRKVSHDGIVLPLGKWDKRTYFGSARLGELIDERVEVYLNPDLPEHIICIHRRSDPRGVNPFSVPLFTPLRANTASREDQQRAREHRRTFLAPGRAEYQRFSPPYSLTIRNELLGSPELRERGGQLNELEGQHRALQTKRAKLGGEIAELAARHNIGVDQAKIKNPEKALQHASQLTPLEEKILRMEAAEASDSP